jgi:hypothetical protein
VIPNARVAVEAVARALGSLNNDVTFVGGIITGLLVTDPAAPPARLTTDIDVFASVATYADAVQLADRLRDLGFTEDSREGAPMCRWLISGIEVDVMSSQPVPGMPSNRWFAGAAVAAQTIAITTELSVRVITAPYFIATKLDAFDDGRRGDLSSSHDIEDIIAVVDGRATIEAEIRAAPASVATFLRERFRSLLADPDFIDAVAGHLPGDSASQARLPLVLARLRAIEVG